MFPLEGKRILSFETWGSGAFHGELLALMGAEVIRNRFVILIQEIVDASLGAYFPARLAGL